jgi:hypothetical protein
MWERLVEQFNIWMLRFRLRDSTRRERRQRVVFLYVCCIGGFLVVLGDTTTPKLSLQGFVSLIGWPIIYTNFALSWWQMDRLEELDHLARLEHGKGYSELKWAERAHLRKQLPKTGRGEKTVLDERDWATRYKAYARSFEILRRVLPTLALVYWAAYVLLRGGWRALLNPVAWIAWTGAFVLTLPSAIAMWNAPDEVGEPHMVTMERGV